MRIGDRYRKFLPWGIYSLLALLVLWPLLGRGFVFALDMVFAPHIRAPVGISAGYLFREFLHYLNFILPGDVIEKVILFSILLLAGVGAHLLYEQIAKINDQRLTIKENGAKKAQATAKPSSTFHLLPSIPAYFAGLLFMINPFVYERLMAGQYNVIFGYALLPWFARSLLKFLNLAGSYPARRTQSSQIAGYQIAGYDPAMLRQAVCVALWAVAISIISIHSIGFIAILVLFAGSLKIWQLTHIRGRTSDIKRKNNLKLDPSLRWDDEKERSVSGHSSGGWNPVEKYISLFLPRTDRSKKQLITLLKYGAISIAIFLLASSYWLPATILGKGTTATTISSFSTNDQAAFETVGNGWVGRLGNVLHLQGFWVEDTDTFTAPQANMGATWGILAVMIWILIITGIAKFWREGRKDVVFIFGGSAALATILAVGTLNGWLADNVPLFAGYREPQKFVALIALSLTLFAAHGAATVLEYCLVNGGKLFVVGASVILFAIPLIWTHQMLWGFNGQLFASNYPPGWYAVNDLLNADKSDFQTLFLPWHLYMAYLFAGHIVASPAPQFFDKPVIVSDNPEFEGIARSNSSPEKQRLDKILPGQHDNNIADELGKLGIKYIILDKDDDYLKYMNLYRQKDLKIVYNSDTLVLFQNKAY